MKTIYNEHKWMQIIFGGLLLAAGICIIVAGILNPGNVTVWLSVILAIALFILSAALIFSGIFSLSKKYFDLAFILGALAIALGVVLCVDTQILGGFILVFIAALLLAFGAITIGEAAAMIFFKRKVAAIVLFFIAGAVLITLGVLSLCFKVEAAKVIYVVLGAFIAVAGIVELVFGIKAAVALSKLHKAEKKVSKELEKINAKEEQAAIEEAQPEVKEVEHKEEEKDPKELN